MAKDWRILLVEDDYDSVRMVSKILSFHGVEVHVARNGEEGLAMLNTVTPVLIVTDLAMPDMDGWELLSALRSQPQTAHIPVVAITTYDSAQVAEKATDAGFDAYFSKPVNPRTFVQELEKLIEG